MMARGAATDALDTTVAGLATDAATASELFAIVDLLDDQAMLRRSLSDPSASFEGRAGLAASLFRGRVSAAALEVLTEALKATWSSGADLAAGLERQGIRLALASAHRAGQLDQASDELHTLATTIDGSPELAGVLRNQTYPVAAKQALIDRIIEGKVLPVTRILAARAVRARRRNFARTVGETLQMAADLAGERIAKVTVARPLDESRISRLTQALAAQVGGPVALQIEVDPSVLGGINVAIGDDVFEATVAARLDHARRQLITS